MKTTLLFTLLLLSYAMVTLGQVTPPAPTPWAVISRTANSAVWQRTIYEPAPGSKFMPHTERYVELATGLNHLANGKNVPSSDQIELSPDRTSASATNGEHQAYFPNDIATGTIKLVTPGGLQLISRPIALAYDDGSNTVLIALLTNSVGTVMGANQVVYSNAFQGVSASIRYTYTKAGFQQDVILEAQLPSPQSLKLNLQTTKLQVITEFFNPPQPAQMPGPTNLQNDLQDTTLTFGRMTMIQGRAFLINGQKEQSPGLGGTPTYKHWLNLEGRTFLIENVPYNRIVSQLQTLPVQASATVPPRSSLLHKVSTLRRLLETYPVKMAMGNRPSKPMRQLAQADFQKKSGVVLDYVMLNGSLTNYTFQGDTTYFISGPVYLNGTNIFEGGAVIKYTNNLVAAIVSVFNLLHPTQLQMLTSAYRPVIFTAMDDNSVGATISGSTGNPTNYYANYALELPGNSSPLQYLNIRYAQVAIRVSASIAFRNIKIVNCQSGIKLIAGTLSLGNSLFANVPYDFNLTTPEGSVSINAQNATFSSGSYLVYNPYGEYGFPTNWTASLTNCIFANVTNENSDPSADLVTGDHNGFYNSAEFGNNQIPDNSYPFQIVGGGSYYLADECPFLNAGTTNIDPALLADLATRTTYPPILYSNSTFTTAQTFNPQAQRDTDTPDLGYHYDPLDYVFGGCFADSNMTFTAGTAVGWFRTSSGFNGYEGMGLYVHTNVVATFQGTEEAPDYWVRLNTVQENDTSGGYGPGGLDAGDDDQYNYNISGSAEVHLRFTRCTMMANDDNFFRDDWGYLIVRATDCEFYGGGIAGYNDSCYLTNCFMDRTVGSQDAGWPGNAYIVRNCTWVGGTLYFTPYESDIPISIRDCAFDGTTYTETGYATGGDYDYNAYTNGATQIPNSGGHNVTNFTSFDWQSGPLGNYYLPSGSPLINAGDVPASQVGLYHFTTQTNQTIEDDSTAVDIGYHYVALNQYGNPIDSNGDGVPDYLEDANGNGQADSGEIGWNITGDLGLKVVITRPRNGSILP